MKTFWDNVLAEAAGRPILVDLYCCQGGATAGYQKAGYFVIGVDLHLHPRYCGDVAVQADAVAWLLANAEYVRLHVAFVHASPPCQRYSATQRIQGNEHPDLIAPTRKAMLTTRTPGVIENVEDARPELVDPVTLCGAPFGLHTYRHRLFEAVGGWTMQQPVHPAHTQRTVKMGRPIREGDFYHAVGNFNGVGIARRDMGVGWMNRDGVRECIPPVYAEWVIEQFEIHTLTPVSLF